MHRLVGNSLLLGVFAVLMLYVIISLVIPSPIFAAGMSIFLMLSALLGVRRYAPASYDILVNKLRSEKRDGSHFVVLGITFIALGQVYQGVYGVFWEAYGRPMDWIGTWYSRLGHLMTIGGFLSLYFSPTFTEGPPKLKNALIVGILFILSVIGAFLAGGKFFNPTNDELLRFIQIHGASVPSCDASNPYWISSSGRIHGPLSPYRWQIKPKQCFPTQQAAIDAGYRPIGWAKSDSTFQILKRPATEPQPTPEAKE